MIIKCFARLSLPRASSLTFLGNTHVRGHEAQFPQPKKYTQNQYLSTNKLLVSAAMSHSHPTASSSSNFQLIINNALKAYEKRTKEDLLAHPLAAQLQTCNSPGDILAILQQQVQPDQSLPSDDRWSKWLNPTVSVLYALSETLGEGVSLVSLRIPTCLRSALSYTCGRCSHLGKLYLPELVSFSWCASFSILLCSRYNAYIS